MRKPAHFIFVTQSATNESKALIKIIWLKLKNNIDFGLNIIIKRLKMILKFKAKINFTF